MITIKTQEEIALMREGGHALARVLEHVVEKAQSGAALKELNTVAEQEIRATGGNPIFLGYRNSRRDIPYPAALCVSVNDEIVHGVGTRGVVLKEGDIVGLDIGMRYPAENGLCVDMAVTVGVGSIAKEAQRLIGVSEQALREAIALVRPGTQTREISRAIETVCRKAGFSPVHDLTGHGIGKALHEDPPIFCYEDPRLSNVELQEGMVICIEPMVVAGDWRVITDADGWTVRSADGSLAAHFEHTIAVTKNGYEVLTEIS